MGSKLKEKTKLKIRREESIRYCNNCNPKKYLKFNFSFLSENGDSATKDAITLVERLTFLSEEPYLQMMYKYQGDKKKFIEDIPVTKIHIKGNKGIPPKFREIYPTETNEKYSIFRIYPAGKPNGTANPRIIGMIKNTIFYVFYIDWKGNMYSH